MSTPLYCGRFTRQQVIKIFGILQVILAIIITSLGIAIIVKFRVVHHEANSPYEHAIAYLDNPWTTKYGAGIWMGLLLLISGGVASISDVRPGKARLTYAVVVLNALTVLFGMVVVACSVQAIIWYAQCTYTYHDGNRISVRSCSVHDKTTGSSYYWALLLTVVLVIITTVANMSFIVMANLVLFEDCCSGTCFRKILYKYKGGQNPTVNIRTKNTKEFDQEMALPNDVTSQYSNNVYI